MPDVSVDELTFAYPGASATALRSISLRIPAGQFVLLTGPSGGGKSTLALALAGLIPSRVAGAMRGAVYLGADNVSAMEVSQASQRVGMVFQNPENQLIQLTVEEEVAFGPQNLGLSHDEIGRRVEEALRYTGMERLRKEQIYTLSGGQKQRVAISATLAMRPQALVLDEPTSDLDPLGTQEVLGVLRALNHERGMTIVLIEHKVDEVIPWVDRVLLLDQGMVALDDTPRAAFADPQRWAEVGVSTPQMALLSHALPDAFRGAVALSVAEAYAALHETPYARALQAHSARAASHNAVSPSDTSPAPPTTLTDAPPLLSWNDVGLNYGPKQVVRDVSLGIQPGEWVALIGANGSGKTSLASLAMGFQAPSRGAIRFEGTPVKTGAISRQAGKMAYLFQSADSMLFGATVEQELLFGVRRERARQRARRGEQTTITLEHVLATIDLTRERARNPFQLSHGQRKRLALGALLMRRPQMLILDEPTTGQDEGHATAFLRFLDELRRREGLTYLMITHDMRVVATYARRVVVLQNGALALDDPADEVFAHEETLARSGILAPPVAQLYTRLCGRQVKRVTLSVPAFVTALQMSVEAAR